MKAIAFSYQKDEAKSIEVKNPPIPASDEILVKVKFSALDTALDAVKNNEWPVSSMLHKLTKPLILGWHFSGTVVMVGADVAKKKEFEVNTDVFGHLQYSGKTDQGSLAEYITVKANACARAPKGISSDISAASTTEALTALQGLRDVGGLKKNNTTPQSSLNHNNSSQSTVLINGAGGGVGSAAVQIAKRMGAHVTAICSTKDVEFVRKLGADIVIDRKKVSASSSSNDILSGSSCSQGQFDIILDTPNVLPSIKALKYLKAQGSMVLTAPKLGHVWGMLYAKLFTRKKLNMVMVSCNKEDLELVGSWLEDGFHVKIDSVMPIRDIEKAMVRNRDKTKKGRVVIQVQDGW